MFATCLFKRCALLRQVTLLMCDDGSAVSDVTFVDVELSVVTFVLGESGDPTPNVETCSEK